MRKTLITAIGVLLIAGSAAQAHTTHTHRSHHTKAAASEQFRQANASLAIAHTNCEPQEAGNPYDERTDYQGWSAWRQHGAWNSWNYCQ